MILVTTLEDALLPDGVPDPQDPPDAPVRDRWRRRYIAALGRLPQAGIRTTADEHAGAECDVTMRTQWHRHIARLAPSMAYIINDVDPVGSDPESTDAWQQLPGELRSLR